MRLSCSFLLFIPRYFTLFVVDKFVPGPLATRRDELQSCCLAQLTATTSRPMKERVVQDALARQQHWCYDAYSCVEEKTMRAAWNVAWNVAPQTSTPQKRRTFTGKIRVEAHEETHGKRAQKAREKKVWRNRNATWRASCRIHEHSRQFVQIPVAQWSRGRSTSLKPESLDSLFLHYLQAVSSDGHKCLLMSYFDVLHKMPLFGKQYLSPQTQSCTILHGGRQVAPQF